MHILFITGGSIGDAVISTSLLVHLMEAYPKAQFTIAAGPASAPLFEGFPRLERVIVVRKQRWNKHWFTLWQETCSTSWQLVVDIRGSLLSFLLRTKQRKIFSRPNTVLSKRNQLAALFSLALPPQPRLWVKDQWREEAKKLLPSTPFIVLAPKSNAAFKDWPIERFVELAERLLKKPAFEQSTFVVLGLASQKDAIAPLIEALPSDYVTDLVGKTNLHTVCATLKLAQLVISVDSGVMHIAAAVGTPVVGLYGPTNDKTYAPTVSHARIVKVRNFAPGEKEIKGSNLIEQLTVHQVEAAVDDLIKSSAISSAL